MIWPAKALDPKTCELSISSFPYACSRGGNAYIHKIKHACVSWQLWMRQWRAVQGFF